MYSTSRGPPCDSVASCTACYSVLPVLATIRRKINEQDDDDDDDVIAVDVSEQTIKRKVVLRREQIVADFTFSSTRLCLCPMIVSRS